MPYIALQLVGIQVVIGALGIGGTGIVGDLPLVIAFVILAAFTYSSGLRAPASIAIVKDMLIYITAIAAIIVVPLAARRLRQDLRSRAAAASCCWRRRAPNTTGAYGAYATLALGSALALFLYPHSLTGILSANSGHAIRRNAAMLPGYSLMLGLLALVGFFAIAAGVADKLPEFAAGFKQFGKIVAELFEAVGVFGEVVGDAGGDGEEADQRQQAEHERIARQHRGVAADGVPAARAQDAGERMRIEEQRQRRAERERGVGAVGAGGVGPRRRQEELLRRHGGEDLAEAAELDAA